MQRCIYWYPTTWETLCAASWDPLRLPERCCCLAGWGSQSSGKRERRRGGEREREMLASSSPFSWFPWWLAAHRSPARLSHWHGAACSAVINNWAPRAPRRGAGGSACPDAAEPGWPWEAVCYVTLLLRARTRGTSLCALPDSSSDLWELQGTLCACAEQLGRFKAPFFTSFFFFFKCI